LRKTPRKDVDNAQAEDHATETSCNGFISGKPGQYVAMHENPDKPAGTNGAKTEVAALRAEIGRLRLENTELSARLCDLAAQLAGAMPDSRKLNGTTTRDALRNLVIAAEYKDHDTGAHLVRIGYFSALLASVCGYGQAFVRMLLMASPMHDVGKIGVPDHILKKTSLLSADERKIMERHPEYGAHILGNPEAPVLALASEIAFTHHECYDGSGYPRGTSKYDIPLSGRIVAVADVLDALVMDRRYRAAIPWDQAIEIVRAGRGRHFDPDIVDAFLSAEDRAFELCQTMTRGEAPRQLPGLDESADGDPLGFYDAPLNSVAVDRRSTNIDDYLSER
jgi:putative two-component system response regulator